MGSPAQSDLSQYTHAADLPTAAPQAASSPSTDTVTMFSPNGQTGAVRRDKVDAAIKAGGERAVQVKAPDGQSGWVRESKMHAAVDAGGTLVNNTDYVDSTGVGHGTISPTKPTIWQQMRDTVANSAVGHSLEQALPGAADALGLHPSETVNSPTYEQDKGQLLAPQYLAPAVTSAVRALPGIDAAPTNAPDPVKNRVRGALTAAGGLTTPGNLITAAAGGAAAAALPAAASRLISGGFTAQMVKGLYDQHGEYQQAVDSGDINRAQEIQGEMGVNGVMALLSGKHAATGDVHTPAFTNPAGVADVATAGANAVKGAGQTALQAAGSAFKAAQDRIAARKTAAAEASAPALTPAQQSYADAKGMGVNLDLAQATGNVVAKVAKKAIEYVPTGAPKFENRTQANIDALNSHAATVLNDIHPDAQSREDFGNSLRGMLQDHQQQLNTKASDLYDRVDQSMRGKQPNAQGVQDAAKGVLASTADYYKQHPEMMSGATRQAMGIVESAANGKAIDSWGNLQKYRSDLLNMTRSKDIVGTQAEGWLKQMTASVDDAMTNADTSGMTAVDRKNFRDANDLYSQMKSTYDNPQHKFYSMVRNPDGTQVANSATASTPHQFRQILDAAKDLGNDSIGPALQRQIAHRVLNPTDNTGFDLKNLPTRFTRTQKGALNEIMSPDQIQRLQSLADVAKKVHADDNPSGSAKVAAATITGGALVNPITMLPMAKTLAAADVGSRAMTSPKLVDRIMGYKPPEQAETAAQTPPAAAPAAPIQMPSPAAAPAEVPLAAAPPQEPSTPAAAAPPLGRQMTLAEQPKAPPPPPEPDPMQDHPAGRITGIDQDSGLPIVDRSIIDDGRMPKGTRVALPDGREGTIQFHEPVRDRARVVLDDGRRLPNVDAKELKVVPKEESQSAEQVGGNEPAPAGQGAGKEEPAIAAVANEGTTGTDSKPAESAAAVEQPTERGGGDAAPSVAEGRPAAAQIERAKVADLNLDPKRFQYKLNTSPEGVTDLLKGKNWNDDLSGIISAWKDPADGKSYVVNGHHRVTLAKEAGVDSIAARYLDSPNAEHARGTGALQNIAEGRGTALDAAKFMRDTGMTPEHLDNLGISMKEATAKNGIALARLHDSLFDDVVSGKLRENRAVAIGEAAHTPAEQESLVKMLKKSELGGKKVSDDTIHELGRMVRGAETQTTTQDSLFGKQEQTKNLALEKAEASAYIRQKIAEEKRVFGSVADEGRAKRLGSAGNVIDAAKNADIAQKAAQAQELYDRLSTRRGTIDDALNEASQAIAEKKNVTAAKAAAYEKVRAHLSEAIAGNDRINDQGVPADGHPGTAEPQPAAELDRPSRADLEASGQGTLMNRGSAPRVSSEDASAYSSAIAEGNKRNALRVLHSALGVTDKDASFDRGGLHAPAGPADGSPLYDVAKNGTYPEDVYSHNGLRYYSTGEDAMDRQAHSLITSFAGHPNKFVEVYRAVEKDYAAKKLTPGDWVTPIRQYAQDHGEGNVPGGYKIIKQLVHARDIFTSGDSWLEWGFHPQDFKPEIPKGDARLTSLQDRVDHLWSKGSSGTDTLASRRAWQGSPAGFDVYPGEGNHAPMLHAGDDAAKMLGEVNEHLADGKWNAAAMRSGDVDSMTSKLRAIATDQSGKVPASRMKTANDLADALDRARDKDGHAIVVRPGAEDAAGEEQFHAYQHRTAAAFGDVALQVGQSPILRKAQAYMAKEHGYPDDPTTAMLETTAKAANGDWASAGLTLDEAVDFFNEFMGALVKVRGRGVLDDMPTVSKQVMEGRMAYGRGNGDLGSADGGGPAGAGNGLPAAANNAGAAGRGEGVQSRLLASTAQGEHQSRAPEDIAQKLKAWAAGNSTVASPQGTLFRRTRK